MIAYVGKDRYQIFNLAGEVDRKSGSVFARKEGIPNNEPVRTHQQIADIMSKAGEKMDRQAVAKIERKALAKLALLLADLEIE